MIRIITTLLACLALVTPVVAQPYYPNEEERQRNVIMPDAIPECQTAAMATDEALETLRQANLAAKMAWSELTLVRAARRAVLEVVDARTEYLEEPALMPALGALTRIADALHAKYLAVDAAADEAFSAFEAADADMERECVDN